MPYTSIRTLADSVANEQTRYNLKGFHSLTAFVQVFIFFYFGPDLFHWFWRYALTLGEWRNVFFVMNVSAPIAMHGINNIYYSIIYSMNSPFFEQYKITQLPWPWQQPKEQWIAYRNRLAKYVLFNIIGISVLITLIKYFHGYDEYVYSPDKFPSKLEILCQIAFFMLCEDFSFYFSHRFLHWKVIYPYFHKVHHEHNNTISFSPAFAHPVDYFFGSLLPFVLGFEILGSRVHFSTFFLWQFWRILETCDGHCGYEFPWSMFRLIPFSGSSDYHNFHHSKNVGNYSSFFTYLDYIFGTNTDYFDFKVAQQKLESTREKGEEGKKKK